MADELSKFKKRHTALDQVFASWKQDYITISDFILPRRGRFLTSDVNKGGKINNKIINPSATYALRTLSAGMMAGITSPARPWFRLITTDVQVMESSAVKNWLHEVEVILRAIFAKSNFYKALPVLYTELGGFGTGCMVIEEDFDEVIRCTTHTVGSYRLATNKFGLADTMYRDVPFTVQQVVDKFGLENCSENVRSMYNAKALDKYVDVVHVIEPRKVRDHNLATPDNMPIASLWYEKSSNEGSFLRESGYEDNPLIAPRWIADSSDVYGTGPGHDTKGIVKGLQLKERELAKAMQKVINPPMTGPSSMEGKANSVLPGHISFVDTKTGQDGFKPAYQIRPDINAMEESIRQSERQISRGFYEDLFLMISQSDRRQITATEIEERHEEKLLMVGPVLERLNDEALDIAIDRTFNIATRNNMLPPPPEELQGKNLKVEYISILAQAQKSVATSGIQRLAGFVSEIAVAQANGQGAEVIDKFNFDQAVDEFAEALGTSPKLVNSDDDVAVIRQGRAQQQQMAQMLEASQQAAAATKDLSQSDTEGKNALTDILGGQAG